MRKSHEHARYVRRSHGFFSFILFLTYCGFRSCYKRPYDANHSKTKEQNSMFNVHVAISNDMVYAWNEKKYSECNANDSEHNSSVEDCRVLHNIFYTFLLDLPLLGMLIIAGSHIFSRGLTSNLYQVRVLSRKHKITTSETYHHLVVILLQIRLLCNRFGTSHEQANNSNNEQYCTDCESSNCASWMRATYLVINTNGQNYNTNYDSSVENCSILHFMSYLPLLDERPFDCNRSIIITLASPERLYCIKRVKDMQPHTFVPNSHNGYSTMSMGQKKDK